MRNIKYKYKKESLIANSGFFFILQIVLLGFFRSTQEDKNLITRIQKHVILSGVQRSEESIIHILLYPSFRLASFRKADCC